MFKSPRWRKSLPKRLHSLESIAMKQTEVNTNVQITTIWDQTVFLCKVHIQPCVAMVTSITYQHYQKTFYGGVILLFVQVHRATAIMEPDHRNDQLVSNLLLKHGLQCGRGLTARVVWLSDPKVIIVRKCPFDSSLRPHKQTLVLNAADQSNEGAADKQCCSFAPVSSHTAFMRYANAVAYKHRKHLNLWRHFLLPPSSPTHAHTLIHILHNVPRMDEGLASSYPS